MCISTGNIARHIARGMPFGTPRLWNSDVVTQVDRITRIYLPLIVR